MKHSQRRSGAPVRRWVLAATATALVATGGVLGSQVAEARQTPTAASPAAATASAPAKAPAKAPVKATSPATPTRTPRFPARWPASASTTTRATTTSKPATSTKPKTTAPTTSASPTTSTAAPTSTPTAPSTATPLAGRSFYGPNTGAAAAAAAGGRSAADTALLTQLAAVPTALWLGSWSGDVTQTVRQAVTAATAAGAVPVFVAYNIPDTDCGGYSAGGSSSPTAYASWIRSVAAGIGTAEAVVVVEPDALAQLCGDPAVRYAMLDAAIDVLEANPRTHTYLDAGNPTWIGAQEMAGRLRAAGVADADGFALNVSNFETTASNLTYGRAVSAALGGAHFVVDTSRNGNGPGSTWCNPSGRAVGTQPTGSTGQAGVDAFLWVKRPGESDGTCNGGPSAGTFWPDYAIGLMRN